jgi:hypothetical protein
MQTPVAAFTKLYARSAEGSSKETANTRAERASAFLLLSGTN